MTTDDEEMLTVPEAAAYAEVDVSAVWRWFRDGKLSKRTRPVGRTRTWVAKADLDRLLHPVPEAGAPQDRQTA